MSFFSVHLVATHPSPWDVESQPSFRWDPPRSAGSALADRGIVILSADGGGSWGALGLVEWSSSRRPGHRIGRLPLVHRLPTISLGELGVPIEETRPLVLYHDDACDATTRDLGTTSWPLIREALVRRGGAWANAVAEVEQRIFVAAVGTGDEALVASLLDRGANPNSTVPHHGGRQTALGLAVMKDSRALVALLLARGADPEARVMHAVYVRRGPQYLDNDDGTSRR